MPTRLSQTELEVAQAIKRARETRRQGDDDWLEDLPDLPENPTGEAVTAIFIGRKAAQTPEGPSE